MTDESAYLKHILEAIAKIERYTAEGEEAFRSDDRTQDAVIRNFEVIGEAVRNLPEQLKAKYAGIPWRRIAGMRDKLIHQYFGVKLDVVWETVVKVLPEFKTQIAEILDRREPDSP